MEMHQVRYFLALCEEQNFTRAAKLCGVAQPSLTRAIRRLENSLGGSLFDRDRANTRLTDLGILVRPEFARIDQSAAEAKRKAEKFAAVRSVNTQHRPMEIFMRVRHVVAVVAVVLLSFGVKILFFSAPSADANINAVPSTSMDVLQMLTDHPHGKDLPAQKMRDMTFVFPAPD